MRKPEELCARLEALLSEAREAGLLPELAPLLRDALSAAVAVEHRPRGPYDVPMRYGMVGASPKMRAVFDLLEKIAPADVPVLIQGETGTGKELVARALHEHGKRAGKAFVAENCAAVPPTLLESELFGHKKGSFTGAVADRDGHFVAADGGTIFLDEIGDMPVEMQAKLLRVLEAGEVRPVGSSRSITVDVRVVAATNRNVARMVQEGGFREDLYYRLNVVCLELPPLRERPEDIEHLVRSFLRRIADEIGRPEVDISPAALEALAQWRWPGNVRELENEIRRALTLSTGMIELDTLSPEISEGL